MGQKEERKWDRRKREKGTEGGEKMGQNEKFPSVPVVVSTSSSRSSSAATISDSDELKTSSEQSSDRV